MNSDDLSGAVGVQPPDGTTERWKLLTHDLASMLVFGGFMPAEAQDDPEGYDNCRTMEKVGYLCDLINGRMSEAVCAEPSMSTTTDGSLSSGSGASGERVQAPDGSTEADKLFKAMRAAEDRYQAFGGGINRMRMIAAQDQYLVLAADKAARELLK